MPGIPAPVVTPTSEFINPQQKVKIVCQAAGVDIFYTLTGDKPEPFDPSNKHTLNKRCVQRRVCTHMHHLLSCVYCGNTHLVAPLPHMAEPVVDLPETAPTEDKQSTVVLSGDEYGDEQLESQVPDPRGGFNPVRKSRKKATASNTRSTTRRDEWAPNASQTTPAEPSWMTATQRQRPPRPLHDQSLLDNPVPSSGHTNHGPPVVERNDSQHQPPHGPTAPPSSAMHAPTWAQTYGPAPGQYYQQGPPQAGNGGYPPQQQQPQQHPPVPPQMQGPSNGIPFSMASAPGYGMTPVASHPYATQAYPYPQQQQQLQPQQPPQHPPYQQFPTPQATGNMSFGAYPQEYNAPQHQHGPQNGQSRPGDNLSLDDTAALVAAKRMQERADLLLAAFNGSGDAIHQAQHTRARERVHDQVKSLTSSFNGGRSVTQRLDASGRMMRPPTADAIRNADTTRAEHELLRSSLMNGSNVPQIAPDAAPTRTGQPARPATAAALAGSTASSSFVFPRTVRVAKQRHVAIQADMLQFEKPNGKKNGARNSVRTEATQPQGPGISDVSPGQGYWRLQVDHLAHFMKQHLRTSHTLQAAIGKPRFKAVEQLRVEETPRHIVVTTWLTKANAPEAGKGEAVPVNAAKTAIERVRLEQARSNTRGAAANTKQRPQSSDLLRNGRRQQRGLRSMEDEEEEDDRESAHTSSRGGVGKGRSRSHAKNNKPADSDSDDGTIDSFSFSSSSEEEDEEEAVSSKVTPRKHKTGSRTPAKSPADGLAATLRQDPTLLLFREVAQFGQGRAQFIKEQLEADVNVNQVDRSSKCTPLYLACKHGHLDAVRELLDHGAKPDILCGRDVRYRNVVSVADAPC
ncbi:uncharacterized protein MONBRDRAFT_27109 [Monosiga brevicollis MX1]|uniref:Uncharacterized protein n=1 Tax=Monosiga brevicollis TaxID=81824 RepID=A9V4B7_MONBE|nr:uncharacterized protein MONBRDRAFT_27109 [Monosiga brevicollis MX1]EDQ87682.1 predicted protein [Monosiga brevicollis MX1]|eukprot:XP_001747602.1 hypothetical protein [Monosiga brevicollis MX1]